jgi:hypothetical protein
MQAKGTFFLASTVVLAFTPARKTHRSYRQIKINQHSLANVIRFFNLRKRMRCQRDLELDRRAAAPALFEFAFAQL